ncbi:indolethylamine N-methyltransferase-like [Gigantopelta aegis]|uniref:indolethylamine N-methyltransferase-like n=1 Tax=Gigantopelta aegis TaxID=1735272 RepID=UPI001B88BAD7|nr:indolethylamine N-methyltransferase-like [Gigantopelta aegis]
MENQLLKGEDYSTVFEPLVYLANYVRDITGHEDQGHFMKFAMDAFHKAFSKANTKGRRLLDVGTGPSIHSVISASKHFDEIYLSDLSTRNLKALAEWKNGTLQHSFHTFFQYVVEKEGEGEDATSREEEMRNKVKDILFVDLLSDTWSELSSKQPYDAVVTSLCLEAVAPSTEIYKSIAGKIVALLKPGGVLVVTGVLGQSFYIVGDHEYYCLSIKEQDIKSVWTGCGLDIELWEWNPNNDRRPGKRSDYEGIFLMMARKK